MAVDERPFYRVRATTLVDWLERQDDTWWDVDGDPILTSRIDFPCPCEELSPVIREIGRDLFVRGMAVPPDAHGEYIDAGRLEELVDATNGRHKKTLLLSWADADIDWLLLDDNSTIRV